MMKPAPQSLRVWLIVAFLHHLGYNAFGCDFLEANDEACFFAEADVAALDLQSQSLLERRDAKDRASVAIQAAEQVVSNANSTVDFRSDCCFGRTTLNVFGLLGGLTMQQEKTHIFRVNIALSAEKDPLLFFRFVLCDAVDVRFCDPLRLGSSNNSDIAFVYDDDSIHPKALKSLLDVGDGVVASQWAHVLRDPAENATVVSVRDLDFGFRIPKDANVGMYQLVLHTMLVQVNASNATTGLLSRLDISQRGTPALVQVIREPKILELSDGVQIFIYCLIGACDLVAVVALGFLVRLKEHPAIRLAQGSFLIGLVIFSIIAATCSFTIMPEKDVYCMLRGPLVHVPLTVMGAILVARLWRVYIALSGALQLKTPTSPTSVRRSERSSWLSQYYIGNWDVLQRIVHALTCLAKLHLFPRGSGQGEATTTTAQGDRHNFPSPFRRNASARETWQLVFFLSLPQALLQFTGAFVYAPVLELETNDSETIGRYYCSQDWAWVQTLGSALTILAFALAVVMAWQGRHLPSVFNEKAAIFNTAGIIAILTVLNGIILQLTSDVTTSPNVSVFLRVNLILCSVLFMLYNIVWPRIWRARSGEKVVVGKLLKAYGDSASAALAANEQRPTFLAGTPIIIHKDDPLPQSVELQVHKLHSFLGTVVHKCGAGKALSREEWDQMQRSVARLKTDLDRVTLEFDEDEQQQNGGQEDVRGDESGLNGATDEKSPGSQENCILTGKEN